MDYQEIDSLVMFFLQALMLVHTLLGRVQQQVDEGC